MCMEGLGKATTIRKENQDLSREERRHAGIATKKDISEKYVLRGKMQNRKMMVARMVIL